MTLNTSCRIALTAAIAELREVADEWRRVAERKGWRNHESGFERGAFFATTEAVERLESIINVEET